MWMDEATTEELDLLKIAMHIKRASNVIMVGGHPFIHCVPAIYEPEPDDLGLGSHWRCPHCKSRLTVDGYICLSGCNMTAPQHMKFQAATIEAHRKVADTRAQIDKLTQGVLKLPMEHLLTMDDIPRQIFRVDVQNYEDLEYYDIVEWFDKQQWSGKVGISSVYGGKVFGLFDTAEDATIFKLTYG